MVVNCIRIDKYPFCSGTFVYWGLGSIPVLMTLVGLIYMFKTNCNPKKKCSQMFSMCKSLEKTDINTIYGEEYYADGCMEVNWHFKIHQNSEKSECVSNISQARDHNSAYYYSSTTEDSVCTRTMDNNSQYEEMWTVLLNHFVFLSSLIQGPWPIFETSRTVGEWK